MQTAGRRIGFSQYAKIDAKGFIGLLGARNRLEHQIHGRAFFNQLDLVSNMGEDARLGWNFVLLYHFIDQTIQVHQAGDAVGGRVDADHGIAGAIQQAIQQRSGNAAWIIGRMVRLQAYRQAARQPYGIAKRRGYLTFFGHQNQILIAHQFADCGRHFRCNALGHALECRTVGRVQQQPVSKISHGQVADFRKGCTVVGVDNQPRHLIALIRNQQLLQKALEWHRSQTHARRHAFDIGFGRHPGQKITRTRWCGFGHHLFQVFKLVLVYAHTVTVGHRFLLPDMVQTRLACLP